jgi:drug/metabolite transporter (DMT)-like permease
MMALCHQGPPRETLLDHSPHHDHLGALSPRARGLIAINVAAVIFGSAALFGKLPISPVWIVFARALLAAATLLVVNLIQRTPWRIGTQDLKDLTVSGAALALHWLGFYATVQWSGVAVATLTFSTLPLCTLLIEAARTQRIPSGLEMGCAAAIIVAVALLGSVKDIPHPTLGVVTGLLSTVAYAVFWDAGRGIARRRASTTVALWQNAAVAILTAPLLGWAERAPTNVATLGWLCWFGAVNTALALVLYRYALHRLKASTCSAFIALEPVYAIAMAGLLFGDRIGAGIWESGGLILGASILLYRRESASA